MPSNSTITNGNSQQKWNTSAKTLKIITNPLIQNPQCNPPQKNKKP